MHSFETTGHTLSYILLELAANPDLQERCVRELRTHGLASDPARSQGPRELEWDDLGQLTFMNNVIKEAMRLYPVGTGTIRV